MGATVMRVIEIVGVAGAGKTTLAAGLRQRPATVVAPTLPRSAILSALPEMLAGPLFELIRYSRRGFLLQNIRLLLHMLATLRWLGTTRPAEDLVYDQGPAYTLASFCYFGFPDRAAGYLQRMRMRVLARYLARLDVLVYLRVDQQTAESRVGQRTSYHMLKDFDAATATAFIQYYRDYYDELADTARQKGVTVLSVDAGAADPAEVLAKVRRELDATVDRAKA